MLAGRAAGISSLRVMCMLALLMVFVARPAAVSAGGLAADANAMLLRTDSASAMVSELIPYDAKAKRELARLRLASLRDDAPIVELLVFLARSTVRTQPTKLTGLTYAREAVAIVEGRTTPQDMLPGASAVRRAVNSGQARGGAENYIYGAFLEVAQLYQRAQSSTTPRLVDEVFMAAQYVGVSRETEAMARVAARLAAANAAIADLVTRQQLMTQSIRALAARRSMTEATDQAQARALAEQLTPLGEALALVDARLETDFPQYRALATPRPLSIAAVQARLAPGEALLSLVEAGPHIHVFIVTRGKASWHFADGVAEDTRVSIRQIRCSADPTGCNDDRDFNQWLAESPKADDGMPRFDLYNAYNSYQQLIAPLADEGALNGVGTLFINTRGHIADLPFALLVTDYASIGDVDDADPAVLARANYLSDRFALITLPAIPALRLGTSATAPTTRQFVGYGDPRLDGLPADRRGAEPKSYFRAIAGTTARMADPASLLTLTPLPGTRVELTAMAAVERAGADSLRLGSAATETAVRDDDQLGAASLVAFATHGLLPREVTGLDEPGLVFTPPASATAIDDGVLTASEVVGLHLSADLVILSACTRQRVPRAPANRIAFRAWHAPFFMQAQNRCWRANGGSTTT